MKYVLLPLLATGAPCLINIDKIATAYEDTNRDKQRGLKIYTTDGDYTFVDCTLHGLVMRLKYECDTKDLSELASIDKGTGTIVGGGPDEQ